MKAPRIALWGGIAAMLALVALMLPQSFSSPKTQLAVLSGSENETLESILQEFSRDNGIEINMAYKGSLDIMNILDSGEIADYDAVWPANSLWISLGDKHKIVEDAKSVMTSPIVFGVRKSLAEQLGFVGREVSVKDILEAIEQKKLTFMMTSATQSNSGASAYIGFIYALLGNPETIASEDLDDPQFRDELKKLLGGVNRSSGSSGWLKELFLLGDYDSMVNYESMVIEANQRLVGEGREPLYAVYPYDGLTVSDSPLGFIDSGDENKKQAFAKLQQYLLSEPVQKQILALGRRTGIGGVAEGADRSVFNPDWGIDAQKTVSGLRMPAADVIMQALNLYQSELKKPSYTIYCLDYSGSMGGEREKRLKDAMRLILDQEQAKQHLLQATPQDVTTVMPFNHDVLGAWTVAGDDEGELGALSWRIDRLAVGGGTNIYAPVTAAIEELKHIDIDRYVPAIVLLTDGASNNGTFEQFERAYRRSALDVPVFAIKFGDASDDQLQALAELSRGAVFDGQKDLTSAFKKVRGYN